MGKKAQVQKKVVLEPKSVEVMEISPDEAVETKKDAAENKTAVLSPTSVEVMEISPDTAVKTKKETAQREKAMSLSRSSRNKETTMSLSRSSRNKVATMSSILAARSKAFSGVAETKRKEPVIGIDAGDMDNKLAVVEYVEDIYKFYKIMEATTDLTRTESTTQLHQDPKTTIISTTTNRIPKFITNPNRRHLGPFSPDPPSKLDILGHDSDPLGMDRAQIGILEQPHQIRLRSLLQRGDGRALEPEIGLEVLRDLANKSLEREFPDEEFGAFLVLPYLPQRHRPRPEPVRLLHTAGRRSRFPRRFRRKLLTWGLTACRLPRRLLRTSHFDEERIWKIGEFGRAGLGGKIFGGSDRGFGMMREPFDGILSADEALGSLFQKANYGPNGSRVAQ
ncbi:G2/mitotic-specific cyclin-1-like protein [Drosera capensis]